MDLKEVGILGDEIERHWFFRAKRAAIIRQVERLGSRRALDIGAGSGFFSRALLERTVVEEAICVDPFYDADSDATVAGKPLRFRREAPETQADLVLMTDVLEHIERDLAFLSEHVERAAPGTDFLISVPALKWMWSGHDVYLDHWRRYTLPEVTDLARYSGLSVVSSCYFFAAILPIAAAVRMPDIWANLRGRAVVPRSSLSRHSWLVNAALAGLCALEVPVMRFNRLGGLSAFVHARKDGARRA